MGTTPILDLPYPEGATDKVRNGATAIRVLAEAVETAIDPGSTILQIERAESAAATGGAVDFPGTVTGDEAFAYASGVITYSGPERLFLIDVEVETQASASGGVDSGVNLFVNGTEIAGSYDRVDATGTVTRFVVHRITTPTRLIPGVTINVTCGGTVGTLGKTGIRIYPISPVLS